jgi:hypothetical protein
MRIALMVAAVAASTLALAACGGDDGSSAEATTSAAETVETAPPTTETTATTPTTETETTPTTPKPPQAKVVAIRVVDGVPEGGIQRPTLEQGEKVVLVIRTDTGDGVHLHGYDIEKHIDPGKPVRIPFTATIAGRFELELHPTDTLLAVLQVQP